MGGWHVLAQGTFSYILQVVVRRCFFYARSFTLENPVAYGPSKQEMGGDAAPDAFIASRMVVGDQVNMKFLK